jgi:hypothetical protein
LPSAAVIRNPRDAEITKAATMKTAFMVVIIGKLWRETSFADHFRHDEYEEGSAQPTTEEEIN